jgi:hypothetical protein
METEESSEEPPSPSAAKPECRALNPCSGRGGVPAGPVQRRGPLQQEGAAVPYRQLETSLFCLRLMVSGCGPDFEPYFEESLLDLLVRTGQHPSRFVREAGFHVLNSLVSVCTQSRCAAGVVSSAADGDEDCCHDMEIEEEEEETSCPAAPSVGSPLERFSLPLAQMLAAGLADTTENWAQVR